jgi:deoxyribodipyrimidine photo-lyase
MQSGTTGINALRIYNPIKQVYDQDPQGLFLRRWLPELAQVPLAYLAEPHKLPPGQQPLRQGYPDPLVDHQRAMTLARTRMAAVRGQHPEESRQILQRHGSRKQGQLFDEVDDWDGAPA